MLESWITRLYHRQAGSQRTIRRLWMIVCTAIAILIVSTLTHPLLAQPDSNQSPSLQLPDSAIHSLPILLEDWRDPTNTGDYFDQISSFGFGYLVWSHFPIRIYINPKPDDITSHLTEEQLKNWYQAIELAVQEWNQFIPFEISDSPDQADIIVLAQTPPLRWSTAPQSSSQDATEVASEPEQLPIPRAQTAETTFKVALEEVNGQTVMRQKYTIQLSPSQSLNYLEATARHELGHALGIWGHSPVQEDALYFSQVRTPPSISTRDINTLKKIYQQPTQLGWPLIASE